MRTRLISLASLLLASCATTPSPSTPIPERDIAAFGAPLQKATILDTQLFTPQYALKGCKSKAFPMASPTPKLAEALAKAKAYSDEAKGLGLLVLKDGAVLHESYVAPATAESLTSSASMMKSVVGLITGIALEKRMIHSVDDPVKLYLPEWQGDPRGDLTVRHLLTMASGLGASDFNKLLLSTDINKVALATPYKTTPGSKFAYGNGNSQLIGLIIDRQARKKGYKGFADLMQRAFWCPLGNGNASLWIDREGGSPRYYAGLHASLSDWGSIGELIRNKGRARGKQIVSASWIAEMSKPSLANPAYGYQIWRGSPWVEKRSYNDENPVKIPHSAPYLADDVLFFDGFGGQRVYIIPSKGITIARTGYTNLAYDDAVIVNAVLAGL
jgi:CubicO group peptidase (beta-lactamase class C family)